MFLSFFNVRSSNPKSMALLLPRLCVVKPHINATKDNPFRTIIVTQQFYEKERNKTKTKFLHNIFLSSKKT